MGVLGNFRLLGESAICMCGSALAGALAEAADRSNQVTNANRLILHPPKAARIEGYFADAHPIFAFSLFLSPCLFICSLI